MRSRSTEGQGKRSMYILSSMGILFGFVRGGCVMKQSVEGCWSSSGGEEGVRNPGPASAFVPWVCVCCVLENNKNITRPNSTCTERRVEGIGIGKQGIGRVVGW